MRPQHERLGHDRPEALELLQRPARRRAVVPGLHRATHVPAVPEDGGRAEPKPPFSRAAIIPGGSTGSLCVRLDGDDLEIHYRHILVELGKQPGTLGVIFRKAQNKIQDPAKLKRLVSDLIDKEQWMTLDADVKGDAYEGLLAKNAEDVKTGAGQYFTPRALIKAIVDVMRPDAGRRVCDPACGTGGFLLAAYEHMKSATTLDPDQKRFLRDEALRGWEIVDATAGSAR